MKRLFNRFSGLHGLALVMLIIVFSFFNIYNSEDLKKDPVTPATSYIEGLRIIHRIKGDTIWSIMAKRADFTKDEKSAKMSSIVIDVKKENLTINAERGVFDLETKDLKLEDNIVLKSKGYEVILKDLSWNPARGLLTSDQKIALRGNRFSIEGYGLSATEKQKLRLHKNVRAVFF